MKLLQNIAVLLSVITVFGSCEIQEVLHGADRVFYGCSELRKVLPSKTFYAESPHYQDQQTHYWTSQQVTDIDPKCRVAPSSINDLHAIFRTIGKHQVPFAIKSGGHTTVTGASNIDNGITIDLAHLNSIEVSNDYSTAWIGVGSTWISVYRHPTLTAAGLSVTGARAGTVGVGGFILGGGSSWHSGRHGWACDTVLDYEVILSNGSAVYANEHSNPDLYWALKGGGGNFGIVTKVKLPLIKQDPMYLAVTWYEESDLDDVLMAIEDFTAKGEDPDANLLLTVACDATWGMCFSPIMFVNTGGNTTSPAFAPLEKFENVENNTDVTDMGSVSEMLNDYPGKKYRKEKFTLTFLNTGSGPLMSSIVSLLRSSFQNSTLYAGARMIGTSFQPLTATHISSSSNTFNLDTKDGALILFSAEVHWDSSIHDARFHALLRLFEKTVREKAEAAGLLHPFVYLNYAAAWQKPFESYGETNLRRLRAVRDRYDPAHIFTKLQPGSLHL